MAIFRRFECRNFKKFTLGPNHGGASGRYKNQQLHVRQKYFLTGHHVRQTNFCYFAACIINNLRDIGHLKGEGVSSYEKYKTKYIASFIFQLKPRTKRKREDHSSSLLLLSIRNLLFFVVG